MHFCIYSTFPYSDVSESSPMLARTQKYSLALFFSSPFSSQSHINTFAAGAVSSHTSSCPHASHRKCTVRTSSSFFKDTLHAFCWAPQRPDQFLPNPLYELATAAYPDVDVSSASACWLSWTNSPQAVRHVAIATITSSRTDRKMFFMAYLPMTCQPISRLWCVSRRFARSVILLYHILHNQSTFLRNVYFYPQISKSICLINLLA